jgi:hypothetical protein
MARPLPVYRYRPGYRYRSSWEEADPRFLVSVLPDVLESIRYPSLFGYAGCKGWEPSGPRVLADDELVVAGKCFWEDPFSRQPLFIRSLHRGRWHVLRWLTGRIRTGARRRRFTARSWHAALASADRVRSADL